MKLVKSLLISLIMSAGLQLGAQTISGTISGNVSNQPPAGGVPVITEVVRTSPPAGVIFTDTIFTNFAGNYSSSFTITYNSSASYFSRAIITNDCQNNYLTDTLILDTTTAARNPVFNFNFCTATCNSNWNSTTVGPTTVSFNNLSAPNHSFVSYSWNFGDFNGSGAKNPTHTYNNYGIYNVCLTVWDSLTSCSSQFCDSVVLINNCRADFSFSTNQLTANFLNFSTGNANAYLWDFGDGSSSGVFNPQHTFAAAGSYRVCLYTIDTTLAFNPICDSICKMVTVSAPPTGMRIEGNITTSNTAPGAGIVYLITADSNGFLTAIDSTNISMAIGNRYSFQVTSGTYYVKAALMPWNVNYSSYLPTYYNNSLSWSTASAIVMTTSSSLNNDINLIQGVNPGGPAFIGGLVSLGANKVAGPGDPYTNATVILTDMSGGAVSYDVTDLDGEFEFNNLAYGTYELFVDILGKTAYSRIITLDANNQRVEDANFVVSKDKVSTGIRSFDDVSITGLYPNPTDDITRLNLVVETAASAELSITDVTGRKLINRTINLIPGNQSIELDLSDLPNGIYLINLVTGKSNNTQRLIKN